MFVLSEQQRAIFDTATGFGAEHLAPLALQWEQDRHFPVQVLREAGRLKMGGLHVGQDVGGQALSGWTPPWSSRALRPDAWRSQAASRTTSDT